MNMDPTNLSMPTSAILDSKKVSSFLPADESSILPPPLPLTFVQRKYNHDSTTIHDIWESHAKSRDSGVASVEAIARQKLARWATTRGLHHYSNFMKQS